jgi:hypothetical protein
LLLAALGTIALFSRPPGKPLRTDDGPLLPRASFLRAIFPAHRHLVSDFYWILTINQVGKANSVTEYRDVYFLANLATDLDPQFRQVYTFAGVIIPVHLGREEYANADESTALLRKGDQNIPNEFKIRFQLAFNEMFFHRRYEAAAEILKSLMSHPSAPTWLGAMVTRLYAHVGQFDASLAFTEQLRDSAEDEETRASYERRILEIEQEKVLRELDAVIKRFVDREGHAPESIAALVVSGDLAELPKDPLEGTFFLDSKGRARSTSSKRRLELLIDEREINDEPAEAP